MPAPSPSAPQGPKILGWKAALAPLSGAAGGRDLGPLRRLAAFAGRYAGRLSIAILAAVVSAALVLAGPFMWSRLVDAIVPGGDPSVLGQVTLLLIGIYICQGFFSFLASFFFSLVSQKVILDLRLRLFEHLQGLSLSFFSYRRTGDLVSRVMTDVASIRGVLGSDLGSLISQVVIFVGALARILVSDWRLTLLMLALVPVVSLASVLLGRWMRRISVRVMDQYARVTTILEESISGIRTVRSFVREAFETRRFGRGLHKLYDLAIKQLWLEVSFGPLISVLLLSATVVIVWFGGQRVLAGEITTGQLVEFIVLTSIMAGSISFFGGLWARLQQAAGATTRLFQILDLRSEMAEPEDGRELPEIRGEITFEGVDFAYARAAPGELGEEPGDLPVIEGKAAAAPRVLSGIDLVVAPGEVLALVGPSGSGKTTLMHLIPRFFDPTEGRITIDGIDLKDVTSASLRRQIALVAQETQLFGGTVRENLLYGRLDADEGEMIAAAEAANAHEFIQAMPEGYDTIVGERAVRLSGGQRQRIAIARALLKDPRVLLLDEATSALDNESETLVQEALERLMRGRTTVVIAHRLSTVRNAHRIAVLVHGRIVEVGTHGELLAAGGAYAALYRHELAPNPDAVGV